MTRGPDFFAPRMSRFKPSASQLAAVRVRELVAAGRDIIKLTTGEPDFPTPDIAKEAAQRCMADNDIRYSPVNGTLALRKAIVQKFERDNGLTFGLDQIAVGSGTKQVLFNTWMATLHAEDEVIISAPYWTAYPDMIKLAGGVPVVVDCPQSANFKMTPVQLEDAITDRTKWVTLCAPGNPTGATYSAAELKALGDVLLDHPHVHVLCDDVYEHLIFDGREFATIVAVVPELADRTVVCNGVSKAYSMTGWRVGFGAGPADIIAQVTKMQGQSTAGIGSVSQAAAAAALSAPLDLVRERTANLQRRRDLLFRGLNAVDDLQCALPEGAMYIYCSCAGVMGKRTPDDKILNNDTDFVMYLLDSVGVAVVQGEAYGMSPAFRACFVAPENVLRDAGERIAQACAALT